MDGESKKSDSENPPMESPVQINGLSNGSANSFMSTLQSLQIHTVGSSILPANDFQCDLQNQFLLEQIQLRAMQTVYNSFGQKPTSQLSGQSLQQTQGNIILPFNSISENASSSHKTTNAVTSNFNEKKISHSAVEDWMKTICVESLLNPQKGNYTTAPFQLSNGKTQDLSLLKVSDSQACDEPQVSTGLSRNDEKIPSKIEKQKELSVSAEESSSRIDFDEAHDDVENIFGLSLEDNDAQSNLIFPRPPSTNRGLSPIDFTPPDSPHEELTLDMLFGIPSQSKSEDRRSISVDREENVHTEGKNQHTVSTTTPCKPNIAETPIGPKKIPVYKQKAVLMSIEASESARKDDPNYDAFEFEDDEDILCDTYGKRENEVLKLTNQKIVKKYVHGRGFEVTNGTVNDPNSIPNKKQQSKPLVLTPEIQSETFHTAADTLRNRNDQRISCSFIQPSQSIDTECCKNKRVSRPDEPLLPKIVIRVQHEPIYYDDLISSKKRIKRRKTQNDEDSDWDDNTAKRKKVYKTIYSIDNISDERRHATTKRTDMESSPNLCDVVKKRLNLFGPADGVLPKGTYVVCKQDILREDCAIWRVDNQNLLQKFPPFREMQSERQVYKSSSTYSGWCEQVSSQYVRVSVRIIKQNRSETTIEPEIPLDDLFPAISTEMFKTPRSIHIKCESISQDVSPDCSNSRIVALTTLINALLKQAFIANHIENLLDKDDWSYTRSVSEIENVNKKFGEIIRKRIHLEKKHNEWIDEYTRVIVSRSSFHCLTKCQVCKKKKPRRIIHFYDKKKYDDNTLVIEADIPQEEQPTNYEVAVDAISCGRCAMAVNYLHQMKHMKLHLLRACEEKLEEIGTTEIDLTLEKSVEIAKSDDLWMNEVMKRLLNMWEDVHFQFRDI